MIKHIKNTIRAKAITTAETRILLAGRHIEDFSESEFNVIAKEEEDKILSDYKNKGFMMVGVLFGLSFGIGN
jgi:hypothetical protein